MAKSKNYWKAGTIATLILFLGSLGVNVVSDDEGYIPYSCSIPTVEDMLCYKLSRVNDNGIQSYCYFDRDNAKRFKKCSEGWELLQPDAIDLSCIPKIIAYTDDGKYYCTEQEGEMVCVDEELQQV